MATHKAELLAPYHERRRRPRQADAFGWIHRWARLGGAVPRLANAASHAPGPSGLLRAMAGITQRREIPRFGRRPFKQAFAARARRADAGAAHRRVVLWPDTFNNFFFPDTLMAAVAVLQDAGYRVVVPAEPLCCGRALYDDGMIDMARGLWERTMVALGEHIRAGTPVVGIEPSCTAAFRDELPGLFPRDERARRLSAQTHTLGEFLVDVADSYAVPHLDGHALVHRHCHHKANMGMDPEVEVLSRMGLEIEVLDADCCGLAGAFGFEADHDDVSMAAGERALLPAVREADDSALIIADGFCCREQILHATGRRALHLAEALRLARQS
jgi:Fe-S oxidoreductase